MRWTVETNGGTMTVNRSQSATDALLDMATDVHRYMLEGGLEDPEGYDHYQFQRGYLHALAMAADKDEDLQQIVRNALEYAETLVKPELAEEAE